MLSIIAAMAASVTLCVRMKKLPAFLELEAPTQAEQPIACDMLLMRCWLVRHSEGNDGVTFPVRRGESRKRDFRESAGCNV
jgi:hypothetical protein